MYKKQKPVRLGVTISPDLLRQMKECLSKVNEDKTLKYVSQSEFISEAVKQLLVKESIWVKEKQLNNL